MSERKVNDANVMLGSESDRPINRPNHVRVGTLSLAVKHPEIDSVGAGSHPEESLLNPILHRETASAIAVAGDDAGHVRAVTVGIE